MILYMAGYESIYNAYKMPLERDQSVFLSYFYRTPAETTMKFLAEYGHRGLITVDSGAHTFFNYFGTSVTSLDGKTSLDRMPDPYEYFEKYLEWAKTWRDYYSFFVELDLHVIVGYKQVKEWRKRIADAGLADKCIYVHHSYNSMEDYDDLLKASESRYIGLEGVKTESILPYGILIKKAYEAGCAVHGFAMTKPDYLDKYPFFSVDSSSWTACTRFGKLKIYDDKKGRVVDIASTEQNFKKYGIDPALLSSNREREASYRKLELCAREYFKYEKQLFRVWRARKVTWAERLSWYQSKISQNATAVSGSSGSPPN